MTTRGPRFLSGNKNILTLMVVMLLNSTNILKTKASCTEVSEL